MEKLKYDITTEKWVIQKVEETVPPLRSDAFHKVLEMFATGDFFYFIFIPEKEQITHCSSGIREVLGYRPQEVDFSFLESNIHRDDAPVVEAFEKAASEFYADRDPEVQWKYKVQYDLRLKTKFGRFKKVLYQGVPYRRTEAGCTVQLSVFTDIGHLKKSNDQSLAIVNIADGTSPQGVFSESVTRETPRLSRREKEVFTRFLRGEDTTHIAEELCISKATTENHLKRIRLRTNAANLMQLMARALEENWIKL